MSGFVIVILMIQLGAVPSPFSIAGLSKAATPSGDLHIGFLEYVDYLNPFQGTTDPAYLFYGLIYDYLFAFDPDGNLIPNLATNATCDATCQSWTYTIRQNVTWSDGTPFTAADVNFTINYNIANFFQLWAFEPYVNRIVQCGAQTRPYCGAVQISQWKVQVFFDRPFVPGRQVWLPIIQKAQWEKISPSQAQYHFINANPIGTGPYRATPNLYNEYLNNLPLHLVANDKYHDLGDPAHPYRTGPPSVANIYLQQFQTESSMVSALESGSIQLAKFTSFGYGAVAGWPNIERQEDLEVTQYWNEIGITQYQAPNGKTPGLNPARFDINVRQALAKATNKDHIIQSYYDGKGYRGSDLMSYLTPQWWYDPVTDGTNLTYDLTAANAQLDHAGYTTMVPDPQAICPNGVRSATNAMTVIGNDKLSENDTIAIPKGQTLTFTMAVRQEFKQEQLTAQYLQTNWCKIGVSIVTKVEAEATLTSDVYGPPPSVEMYIWYWSGDPDPNYLLSIQSGYTLDGWNDNYWNNGTYNALYRAQLTEFNATKRGALVLQAQRIHYESAVYIVYIYPYGEWAYRTDCWSNWGDWVAHPFLQMDAFWGAPLLFFNLQNTCATGPPPTPPSQPTINGQTSGATFAAFANSSFPLVGASTDANASETLTFYWTFGDNTTSQTSHPNAAGKTIYDYVNKTWRIPSATPYQVTLTVGDGTTFSLETVVYVNVSAPPSKSESAWVNGTVRDEANHPLAGVAVTPSPSGAQVQSATDGSYSLLLNATTPTYTITFSKQLYLERNETVSVTAGKTTWLNVSLAENVGWVIGTVKSTSGAVLSGASISVAAGGTTYPGVTGTDGRYNVSAAPGTYTVTASKDGYESASTPSVAVSLGHATTQDFSLSVVVPPTQPISPLLIAGVSLIAVVVAIALVVVLLTRRRKKKEEAEARINLPPK